MAAGDVKIITAIHDPKKAIVCDGTADYVQIDAWGAAREAGGTADTVGTFTAWVNIVSQADSYSIISAGDTNAIEYINFQIVNGYLNISLADGGVKKFDIESDDQVITTDKWHHVAVVQDGVQPVLYVDGKAVAATNDTATDITLWFADLNGIDNANIGVLDANTSVTLDMDGAIGQVKHFNYALTADDILRDFENKPARQVVTDNLISSWDFNGDLVDSVSAHNGTIVNNAYLDEAYSTLTKKAHLAWVAAGDNWEFISTGNQFYILHVEGV